MSSELIISGEEDKANKKPNLLVIGSVGIPSSVGIAHILSSHGIRKGDVEVITPDQYRERGMIMEEVLVKNSPSDKPIDCGLIENTKNVFTIKNYNPLTQGELKTAYDKKTSPKHHNKGYKNHRKNNKNRKTHRK